MSLSKSDLNGLFQFSKITLDKSKAVMAADPEVSSETLSGSETELNVINETLLATGQGAAVSENRDGQRR